MQSLLSEANNGLFSETYNVHESFAAFQTAVHSQSTMASLALGINVSISVYGIPITPSDQGE